MELYLISYCWNFSCLVLVLTQIILSYANKVQGTEIITNLFVYGKGRDLGVHRLIGPFLQVPKRWFSHFYVVCAFCSASIFLTTSYVIYMSSRWPHLMASILACMRYPIAVGDMIDAMPVMVVLILEFCQGSRRFYECAYISSYSNSTMSILIYATGLLFYTAFGLSMVVPLTDGALIVGPLQWNHILGIFLFLWAYFKQNKIARQFAKLRHNKSGSVTNTKHHLPCGDLFEYVSCPHFLMEILIYLSFVIICGIGHQVCLSIFLFVIINQTIAGSINHKWYLEKFPNYPKHRKSVFPFLL